jgi:predicted RNase H-like nuclease
VPVCLAGHMRAVLGVDGCRAGWVGALLSADGVVGLVAPTIAELHDRASRLDRPHVVAVDIPIGLPDEGPRRADVLARTELPRGRTSSVFPTPSRAAVAASSHPEANAANRRATGKGLSVQGFHLCAKIAEVDQWVRSGPGVGVLEVHPEVSFTALGADTVLAKRTAAGAATRREALGRAGIEPPRPPPGPGVGADDVLDACAVAWTAVRHLSGRSRSLPEDPEVFSDGLPAAIHV